METEQKYQECCSPHADEHRRPCSKDKELEHALEEARANKSNAVPSNVGHDVHASREEDKPSVEVENETSILEYEKEASELRASMELLRAENIQLKKDVQQGKNDQERLMVKLAADAERLFTLQDELDNAQASLANATQFGPKEYLMQKAKAEAQKRAQIQLVYSQCVKENDSLRHEIGTLENLMARFQEEIVSLSSELSQAQAEVARLSVDASSAMSPADETTFQQQQEDAPSSPQRALPTISPETPPRKRPSKPSTPMATFRKAVVITGEEKAERKG